MTSCDLKLSPGIWSWRDGELRRFQFHIMKRWSKRSAMFMHDFTFIFAYNHYKWFHASAWYIFSIMVLFGGCAATRQEFIDWLFKNESCPQARKQSWYGASFKLISEATIKDFVYNYEQYKLENHLFFIKLNSCAVCCMRDDKQSEGTLSLLR